MLYSSVVPASLNIWDCKRNKLHMHDQLNGGTEHIIIGNHAVLDLTCKV